MDFRELKYFEVIADERQVGRTAERLYKTQPALTKCIDTGWKNSWVRLCSSGWDAAFV
ncbi:bacterial regulatory helix-turn-helix, lysR family protein [Collimonas fungivorans]|uniref:Bacterial regulatory helix-turn-helix, lysR family protein n=1 Tax=Collimonas fungivorans TaxID=158899 RepID=A0A127P5R4_9BURK|nr:bacterial regulatory helix-turn-helix, lysR family protein [Collimonas fungivorans]